VCNSAPFPFLLLTRATFSAIDAFPDEVATTLTEWHRKTKLVLSLNFGGCNPMAGGEIMVGQYVFSPIFYVWRLTQVLAFILASRKPETPSTMHTQPMQKRSKRHSPPLSGKYSVSHLILSNLRGAHCIVAKEARAQYALIPDTCRRFGEHTLHSYSEDTTTQEAERRLSSSSRTRAKAAVPKASGAAPAIVNTSSGTQEPAQQPPSIMPPAPIQEAIVLPTVVLAPSSAQTISLPTEVLAPSSPRPADKSLPPSIQEPARGQETIVPPIEAPGSSSQPLTNKTPPPLQETAIMPLGISPTDATPAIVTSPTTNPAIVTSPATNPAIVTSPNTNPPRVNEGAPAWVAEAAAHLVEVDLGSSWVACINSWLVVEKLVGYGVGEKKVRLVLTLADNYFPLTVQ
jgi:hypothetical protein